jgi:hypothetical protein
VDPPIFVNQRKSHFQLLGSGFFVGSYLEITSLNTWVLFTYRHKPFIRLNIELVILED